MRVLLSCNKFINMVLSVSLLEDAITLLIFASIVWTSSRSSFRLTYPWRDCIKRVSTNDNRLPSDDWKWGVQS
jgi:hypothetical protein